MSRRTCADGFWHASALDRLANWRLLGYKDRVALLTAVGAGRLKAIVK